MTITQQTAPQTDTALDDKDDVKGRQSAPTIENPLRETQRMARVPQPNIMVIFGATGDLTHRKLMPALYNMALDHLLPNNFSVVGFARREYSHDAFRDQVKESINQFSRRRPVDENLWHQFAQGVFYNTSDFDNLDGYKKLGELLDQIDQERGTQHNRLFYLSTPPSYYATIIENLGKAGLAHRQRSGEDHWERVVVEKPFGRDLASALDLNRDVLEVVRENQVFRIDHYLGKELVQNILAFRFANGIFEPIWNRRYIDHVQVTVAETVGIENRAPYYEEAGAFRDMVQNHMLQVLSLVCMEPPVTYDADSIRDEKVKVLKAIHPYTPEQALANVVRAQYSAGFINGQPEPAYREEPRVNPQSTTETYTAVKLMVDNWRWAGVPIFLRHGKRLPKRISEVALFFKSAPHTLFKEFGDDPIEQTVLAMQIQPNEGISLRFGAKVPGPTMQIRPVSMDFRFSTAFGSVSADSYERLILDAMLGDSTLFTRGDEVEAAWTWADSVLDSWKNLNPPLHTYEAGSWGPSEADNLITSDGRDWRRWRRL